MALAVVGLSPYRPIMAQDLNYYDTFIAVARDCPAGTGNEPKPGPKLSVARAQFEMLASDPYRWTQQDVLVASSGALRGRDDLAPEEAERLRAEFLAKPQACMRASPLPKTHGWGLHMDGDGRVAMYAVGAPEYEQLTADERLTQLVAMASKRR